MKLWMAALVAAFLLSGPAMAEPKSYVLSAALVEEIFQKLAKEPYVEVAQIIAKLQAEVQHQPEPAAAPVAPKAGK